MRSRSSRRSDDVSLGGAPRRPTICPSPPLAWKPGRTQDEVQGVESRPSRGIRYLRASTGFRTHRRQLKRVIALHPLPNCRIVLVGKLSVVTYLHEFAHCPGVGRAGCVPVVGQSVSALFSLEQYGRLVHVGHMLNPASRCRPPGSGGEERHEHSSCRFAFDLVVKRKPFDRLFELRS